MNENIVSLIEKLEKGKKPAGIGEVRNFGGKDYQKMASGDWKLVVHPEEKQLENEQNKNKVVSLTDKLKTKIAEKKEISQSEKHLHDIKNQAVVEGQETRSGKPMFTKVEAALAHGYEAADFREVGNFFYDRAQKMAENIAKLEETKQKVDPNFEKIKRVNLQYSRAFLSQANRIDDRRANAEKMKKSTVMMGHADGAEINTADFSMEHKHSLESDWYERIHKIMDGYQFGEAPRCIYLDKGDLYLVKVDDGMYSGVFKKVTYVEEQDGFMEDNAKVRIERMTLPSLVQFCIAKEWIGSMKEVNPIDPVPQIESLTAALSTPVPTPLVESGMDKKLRMMELMAKLLS